MAATESMKSKLMRNWGWVVTFASFLMNFFGFGILYCFSITFVALQEEFSTDSSATSWAGAVPIGLATGVSVIVTPLVDRFENRPVAIAGVFLCCISCILTSIITDFKLIYLTYSTLYGLGIGFCSLASMDLLLQYFPKKNCSRATLIALVGSSSGMLALGPLTYTLIENLGWRNMFRLLGTLLLAVALPATMTFSRPNAHEGAEDNDDDRSKGNAVSAGCRTAKGISFEDNGKRTPNNDFLENLGVDEEILNRDETSIEQRPKDMAAFDNKGFSGEELNRPGGTTDDGSHPGVQRRIGGNSSQVVLTKEQVDNTLTVGNNGGCPARTSDRRRAADLPDDDKAGLKRLESVTLITGDLVIHVETEQSYRPSIPPVGEREDAAVSESKLSSINPMSEDDVVSFKIISISSSISCEISSGYDVEGVKVDRDGILPVVVQQQQHLEAGVKGRVHQGFLQRYRTFFYPDLWLISICITGLPMMNTFYYINIGDFLISRGFERRVIPWVVTTFGISEVAGKILFAAVADRLPFPKIFIYHFACAVGVVVMGCLLVVRTVPALLCLAVATGMIVMMVADALAYSICSQMFRPEDVVRTWTFVMVSQGLGYILGSLFGESIDRTGSYDQAIYTSIGIYALCGLVCTAVPVYQKFFAPERFVMYEHQDECRRKLTMKKRYKPDVLVKVPQ